MKTQNSPADSGQEPGSRKAPARSGARAAVNDILKIAYRRHARGRVARAAMLACLGP
jgi:hypothetical protein